MATTKNVLAIYMEKYFDLKGLRDAGLFQTKDPKKPNYAKSLKDYEAIAERIRNWFGIASIYDYSKLPPFGEGIKKQEPEFISCKEWLLDEGHLFTMLDNN